VPAEIRGKGSNLLSCVSALEMVRSFEYRERVVADVPGEGGELLRNNSILASGWYPIAWYRDLLATVVRHADVTIVRELGRASTRSTVTAVHRIFMRMISPDTLIKQGGRVFSSYFESAAVTVVSETPKLPRVIWSGCHGFDKNCWRDQLGSTEELVVLSGAKLIRARVLSGGEDGDSEMAVEVAWR
jgi:hypothetical protein